MSRVGKNPVTIPDGVEVSVDGRTLRVKGPKGELSRTLPQGIDAAVDGAEVTITRTDDERQTRSFHGLTRTLVANMVEGVTNGYSRSLVLEGIGYRAALQGNKLVLTLGYSHPVEITAPEGIEFEVPSANTIHVRGISKEQVGNVAASVRSKRPISRYRYADGPRGIRFADEQPSYKGVKAGG